MRHKTPDRYDVSEDGHVIRRSCWRDHSGTWSICIEELDRTGTWYTAWEEELPAVTTFRQAHAQCRPQCAISQAAASRLGKGKSHDYADAQRDYRHATQIRQDMLGHVARVKTYEASFQGKKTRVTVPDDDE